MPISVRTILFAALVAVGLPSLYGQQDCEGNSNFPTIVAPAQGEVIPASGLFTASVTFNTVLTASSLVELELQTDQGATIIDVTSLFLPAGQSDFAGQSAASANLDAVALGLVPGPQSLLFRLDVDGVGGPSVRVASFTWNGGAAAPCDETAGAALSTCFLDVSDATRLCYAGTGSACAPSDPTVAAAENQLRSSVSSACTDSEVQSLGFGLLMTANALSDRLVEVCTGNAATLAARMFGGPHAEVLNSGVGDSCLDAAYAESASFLDVAFNLQRDCALDSACNPATVAASIDTEASQSGAAIETACGGAGFLEFLVGLPAANALARARTQSECMTSASHGDTSPLSLRCAPGGLPGVTVVKTQPTGLTPFDPGVPTQVMLDEAVWGTKCGDGSPYAFWVQLPPAGSSPANVVSHMQGGGVCVLQFQCEGVSPSLFEALGDGFNANGILSDDPVESDFANWTKIFLPYCTQDVFTGGGVLQDFGTITVERYGAVNARAALRVLRNIVAGQLNDTTVEGYRPDLMQVVHSGSSAGGFGVMFNLHHLIDEERWVNTTSVNDAALGLDSGSAFGIATLGGIAQANWATRLTQPPYCLASSCVVGPTLNASHSERLLGTPTQQLLILSNQVDNVQINTTGWPDTASFVNEARARYCDSDTLPGVRFFLDAIPSSFHTYLTGNSSYFTFDIAGTTVADWVEQSVSDPSNLPNLTEEGTLTTAYPGVLPFGCP